MISFSRRAQLLVGVGLATMLIVSACGGGSPEPTATPIPVPTATPTAAPTQQPTDTPVPPTDTPAPVQAAEQPTSPLGQPESPLDQPVSPLSAPQGTTGGPSISQAVPSDFTVISQLAADTSAPAPTAGNASLSAVLYSPGVNRVIPGTNFYLTPAIEQDGQLLIPTLYSGPNPESGDVAGFTNDYGQLLLDNVPPGNYYLAVWTVYNWPLAFDSADAQLPLLIQVTAGETKNLGLLYVEWP